MKEITGNLWDYWKSGKYAICVTTNGTIKKDGRAVMGRGCAKEAKEYFLGIDSILGRELIKHGNTFNYLGGAIFAFPVKHNWWEKADIELIKKSAKDLNDFVESGDFTEEVWCQYDGIILPRPGCGNGNLDWETEVKPVIKDILTSNKILIISKENE